ncbi:unnamed protein product [Ceratitis capitata]|uniref:(Mediterranean fruit fly) hypothetical protein n=1 Tax=Ceratitis capitata TaxID=7213 RepID=A0A811UMD4_CERCA|nr:unnamed protein product [Ceratitis capitata]
MLQQQQLPTEAVQKCGATSRALGLRLDLAWLGLLRNVMASQATAGRLTPTNMKTVCRRMHVS